MIFDLVPIAGMATGLLMTAFITWGLVKVFQGPVGQAIGRRLGGHTDNLEEEVLELRDRVEAMADEVRDTQERLDFTERMLAAGTERGVPQIENTHMNSTDGV